MRNLFNIGRVFYGTAITVIGFLTIYYSDFPYMVIPPKHGWIPGLVMIAYIFGATLMLAGSCIIFEKKARPVSLILGTLLLLIFCFYFIPYEFIVSSNYMHFGDWENAAKELALSGSALVIAGYFSKQHELPLTRFLGKLIPLGTILFSTAIISFGVDHFLYAKEGADYVPSWVPWHLFWMYFTGTALIGSGLAIILKIRPRLVATLLGTMIFAWFIMIHVPRMIASSAAYMASEVASAFIALAYSGTAFVIGGAYRQQEPA